MIIQIQPFIDKRDIDIVSKYLSTTWVTEGPATRDFENSFKKFTGAKHALAFCNGTMTLFSALKALGVGRGDEVIVPGMTFIATINAVIMAGATPVVVDADYNSLCLDPAAVEKNITSRTKVIMPVHLYGLSADMDAIMSIAKKHKLFVVEDAAQGVGVKFRGQHVGTFGEYGSFSFYGNKTITTGEGGMLVTNKKSYADSAYEFKNHGRRKKGIFKHDKIGFNFSISDLQSALGVSQLQKAPEIIKAKEKIYNYYRERLDGTVGIDFTEVDKRISPVYWFTNILVGDASALSKKMAQSGVQTRLAFYPIVRQPCYRNFKDIKFAKNLSIGDKIYRRLLSLPSYVGLTVKDIDKVCAAIKSNL